MTETQTGGGAGAATAPFNNPFLEHINTRLTNLPDVKIRYEGENCRVIGLTPNGYLKVLDLSTQKPTSISPTAEQVATVMQQIKW